MLKSPTLLNTLRQASAQDGASAVSRSFARQAPRAPIRTTAPQRSIATSILRTSPTRSQILRQCRTTGARATRQARHNSTKPTPPPAAEVASPPPRTLSERMKEMSRKYGWTVMGIYLGLSALDFPFCYLAVRFFGPERIGKLEHAIVNGFWETVDKVAPSVKEWRESRAAEAVVEESPAETAARESGNVVAYTDSVKSSASIWTQLLLAYGVHKSLIIFRIPITLAITPKVVKTLRGWGWKIGKDVK